MTLKVYNTLTRKKEAFETLEPGKVRMYVCGPTVYAKAHVGHAMSALVFDMIRRYLEYRGFQVLFAMNYTDVDDKIIARANQSGEDPFVFANRFIDDYRQNLEALNVKTATINPRATQEIAQIITIVQGLIDRDNAYAVDGDVYFRVNSDADYGKLSGRKVDEMLAGARIEVDDRKEHPMDFALWKAAKPGEPAWDSPWGAGRPGWHIECSAMNIHHLGEQIDIHGGGNDLIFPHHENEIAQSESFTGKPFARYWMHNGMLQLGGEKMSKSSGKLVTIEDFLSNHSADALRFTVLNSGYRNPLSFSEEIIQQSERALERLQSALRPALPGAIGAAPEALLTLTNQMKASQAGFIDTMDDDLNTAGGLGSIFELVRAINQARAAGATDDEIIEAQKLLRELTLVLGLTLQTKNETGGDAAPLLDLLLELRGELRKQKLWPLSDRIRDRLAELGYIIEDSKEGSTWRQA